MRIAARIAILMVMAIAVPGISAGDAIIARMDVTATVISNCRVTVPPLTFGSYDPLVANSSDPADGTSVVTLTCTRNTNASLSFDAGLSGSAAARALKGPGASPLQYQIYRDSARSQVWGDGAQALHLLSTGISKPQELTVFGRIPPRQEVEPGSYTDVLTATVDF